MKQNMQRDRKKSAISVRCQKTENFNLMHFILQIYSIYNIAEIIERKLLLLRNLPVFAFQNTLLKKMKNQHIRVCLDVCMYICVYIYIFYIYLCQY